MSNNLIIDNNGNEIIESPRETLLKALNPPALDPTMLAIANEVLAGKSPYEVASLLSIPLDIVASVLDKKEIKTYMENIYLNTGYVNRFKRMEIINKVIEQKLLDAAETGIYSGKDLIDWIKVATKEEEIAKPKVNGPTVAVQVNNYDRLIEDLKSDGS